MLTRAKIYKWIGWIVFVPFCGSLMLLIRWVLGYRIKDLKWHRKEYKKLVADQTPLMICSNHLSYVDPILTLYANAHHLWYFFHFGKLNWNIAANEYQKQPFFRLVCNVSKVIFIDRQGSKEHHREVLDTARALMKQSEPVNIFVEGRRSRTGRFDDRKLAYGVGKIISELDECRVLCLYLRSETQKELTSFPKRGSEFTLSRDVLVFRRGEPDFTIEKITRRVADRIMEMERQYFSG